MIAEASNVAIALPELVHFELLIGLLLAHLLADFYLQPYSWIKQRNERHALALPLYFHALIHGVLGTIALVLLSASIDMVAIGISAVILVVSHFIIDVIKSYCTL